MRVLEFVFVYWTLYACIGACIRVLELVCVLVSPYIILSNIKCFSQS